MKTYLTLFLLLIATAGMSQRLTITPSLEKFGDEFSPSYKLYIPYADQKSVMREWSSLIKSHRGKVKSSKDDATATNVIMPLITKDTMTVKARFTEDSEGTLVTAAFEANESFISESENATQSQAVVAVLHDFGLSLAKQGHQNKVSVAEKLVLSQQKENDEIKRRNERLKSENEKMRTQINDNEREINSNEEKLRKLDSDISTSRSALESIRSRASELE